MSAHSATLRGARPKSFDNSPGADVADVIGMFIDPSAFNHITRPILGAAIEVHRTLGPGLLESVYVECLHFELARHSLRFVAQHTVPITYKGIALALVTGSISSSRTWLSSK